MTLSYLSRASSVAPAEKSSTLSLPLTSRRPSGRCSSMTQTILQLIWRNCRRCRVPEEVQLLTGGEASCLLYAISDSGSGQEFLLPARAARQDSPSSAGPPKARQLVVQSTAIPSMPVAPANATHTRTASSTPSFTSFLSSPNTSHTQVDTHSLVQWRVGGRH